MTYEMEAVKFGLGLERQKIEKWAREGHLFALLDPFFELPFDLEKATLETKDTDPVFYEVIAWDQVSYEPPTLVKLNSEALHWILNSLATERWGVFIASDFSLEELAGHYQKFVITRGPDANPYFLRFHDASVLEVLLRTWDKKEKSVFFGPTMAFGLPDLDTMDIHLYENPFKKNGRTLPAPEHCLLNLREEQLKECGRAIDRDLAKVIYWHLRNHHSKAVQYLDQDTLEHRIRFAILKARGYSLGTVSDLAGFTALMFELAPNFDEHPSFHNVLTDPTILPEAKMKRLSQVISDREWKEAAQGFDRNFWTFADKKKKTR